MTFDLFVETRALSNALDALPLPAGVSHAYNPLAYMQSSHERWLSRFVHVGRGLEIDAVPEGATFILPRPYLILGMNPGPWGMVQTGVPFGDVPHAMTILGYRPPPHRETVPAPNLPADRQHPNRPVVGFGCNRVEASGERLWGGLGEVWATSGREYLGKMAHSRSDAEQIESILRDAFAMNYCPLAYFADDKAGTNVTPEELAKSGPRRDEEYAKRLDGVCGPYLRAVIQAMGTRVVLAIGRYAERKAKVAASLLPDGAPRPKVVYLVHPSPLATRSSAEWATMARTAMQAAGVLPPLDGGAS